MTQCAKPHCCSRSLRARSLHELAGVTTRGRSDCSSSFPSRKEKFDSPSRRSRAFCSFSTHRGWLSDELCTMCDSLYLPEFRSGGTHLTRECIASTKSAFDALPLIMVSVSILSSIPSAQDSGISTHLARDTSAMLERETIIKMEGPKQHRQKYRRHWFKRSSTEVLRQQRRKKAKEKMSWCCVVCIRCDMKYGGDPPQPTSIHLTNTTTTGFLPC